MAKEKVTVVTKYYFRKEGKEEFIEDKGYDWIGEPVFELYPIELNDKIGFANCNGDIVIPLIYDHFWPTKVNGKQYLELTQNHLCGLFEPDGTEIVSCQWDKMFVGYLSEDLLPVSDGHQWGFVNIKTGKTQIEPGFDEVLAFKHGYAPVRILNLWGFINRSGTLIIPPKYNFYCCKPVEHIKGASVSTWGSNGHGIAWPVTVDISAYNIMQAYGAY